MTAQQLELLDRLFERLVNLAPEQRDSFLAENCPDREVRTELESLVVYVNDQPVISAHEAIAETAAGLSANALAGQRVGPYRLVSRIGQGGMGSVYRAVRSDDQFQQTVAIKLMRFSHGEPADVQRFRRERQILASLEHPYIARLLDGGGWIPPGSNESQPYLAMEYVEGPPLTVYCDEKRLSIRERLMLFRQVCDACSYAHQHLIVHRDLKPGNVLVTANGTPKLLDFGIAKFLEVEASAGVATVTSTGLRAMTPDYASPEQIRGEAVATATDVYSLGAVLYETLAGRRARELSRLDPLEAAREIAERDVLPPSSFGKRELRGDLDVIVLKAMQTQPSRRYQSVEQLSEDIRRYLAGEPIVARPDTLAYRTTKFVQRHRLGLIGVAAVLLVLLAGIAASTWQAVRASRAERAALVERDRTAAAERTARLDRDRALRAEDTTSRERNRAVAEKERADNEAATAKAVNEFLQTDLLEQAGASTQASTGQKADPDLKVRTALDRAAGRIDGKFMKQPLVEAAIRQTIGVSYKDLGLSAQARQQVERALELRKHVLGGEHPITLESEHSLAQLYYQEGKYVRCEALLIKVLNIQRRVIGEDHPDTLKTMDDLATVYDEQTKHSEAERIYIKVLRIRQRLLGSSHPETVTTMNDLGVMYTDQGKYDKSEPLLTKALEVRRRLWGDEHPDTLITMNNLGTLYTQQGKPAQAQDLYLKLVEISSRVLGEEHHITLTAMGNLATVYKENGKYDKAEPLYAKVAELQNRVLGEEHPETLMTMNNLASMYLRVNKYAAAEKLYSKTLEIRRRVLGDEHPATLINMGNLATVYRNQGNFPESEALYSTALRIQQRVRGGEHPTTLGMMANLAGLHRDRGDYKRAEAMYLEVVRIERRVLGEEHPNTLKASALLGNLYLLENKYDEAQEILTKDLEIRRRVSGPQHPETADAAAALGELWLRKQKYTEAEVLLREAVSSYAASYPDGWRRFKAESLLGACLSSRKTFAEAEPLLLSGYEGLLQRKSKIPVDGQPALEQAATWLIQMYESWNKPEQAAKWRENMRPQAAANAGPNR